MPPNDDYPADWSARFPVRRLSHTFWHRTSRIRKRKLSEMPCAVAGRPKWVEDVYNMSRKLKAQAGRRDSYANILDPAGVERDGLDRGYCDGLRILEDRGARSRRWPTGAW